MHNLGLVSAHLIGGGPAQGCTDFGEGFQSHAARRGSSPHARTHKHTPGTARGTPIGALGTGGSPTTGAGGGSCDRRASRLGRGTPPEPRGLGPPRAQSRGGRRLGRGGGPPADGPGLRAGARRGEMKAGSGEGAAPGDRLQPRRAPRPRARGRGGCPRRSRGNCSGPGRSAGAEPHNLAPGRPERPALPGPPRSRRSAPLGLMGRTAAAPRPNPGLPTGRQAGAKVGLGISRPGPPPPSPRGRGPLPRSRCDLGPEASPLWAHFSHRCPAGREEGGGRVWASRSHLVPFSWREEGAHLQVGGVLGHGF